MICKAGLGSLITQLLGKQASVDVDILGRQIHLRSMVALQGIIKDELETQC